MATDAQIATLRGMIGVAGTSLDDAALSDLIDADPTSTLEAFAANVWGDYASKTATLVNVSESGSTRAMGDVHKNAIAMSKFYRGRATEIVAVTDVSSRPRTRAAVRDGSA